MNQFNPQLAGRILSVTLSLTKDNSKAGLEDIAVKANVSKTVVEKTLSEFLGNQLTDSVHLAAATRLDIAAAAARLGDLKEVAKSLNWQEFEKFTEECLNNTGFVTERNVRFQAEGRKWQVDVVGAKGGLLLCFDCKHWRPPNYPSRFISAATHQRKAAILFATQGRAPNPDNPNKSVLPIILTLHEPFDSLYREVVLLSIEKLPDFLDNINPFSPNLPFVSVEKLAKENPIKELEL